MAEKDDIMSAIPERYRIVKFQSTLSVRRATG